MQAKRVFLIGVLATTVACGANSPTSPTAAGSLSPAASFSALPEGASLLQVQNAAPSKLRKVTSGTMSTAVASLSGSMRLSGARFEITGDWADGGSTGCQPCASGAITFRTAASFAGTRGTATVDGVHYDNVYLSGTIPLIGTATIPAADRTTFTVQYPFTIENPSLLIGYASSPMVGQAQELFRLELRGTGTATVELNSVPLGSTTVYTGRALTYTF